MLVEFDFKDDQLCILRLKGRFITGGDIDYLRSKTEELKASGRRMAMADFQGVPYLDSTGLSFLVSVHIALTKAGGKLVLTNLTPRVKEVLDITKLATIIPVFEDEQSALAALGYSAGRKAAPAES